MAYSKGMLDRYAEAIEDEAQRRQFQEGIGKIEFGQDDGRAMCSGGAVAEALAGTAVEHLADDFGQRYMEFMTPEDFGR